MGVFYSVLLDGDRDQHTASAFLMDSFILTSWMYFFFFKSVAILFLTKFSKNFTLWDLVISKPLANKIQHGEPNYNIANLLFDFL